MTADEIVRHLYYVNKLDLRDAVGTLCTIRNLVMHTFSQPNKTTIMITLSRATTPDSVYALLVEFDWGERALFDKTLVALDEKLKKIPIAIAVAIAPAFVTCARCGLETGVPERHEIYCGAMRDGHDS